MVIIWSLPARKDLRLIHQYIADDSKRYAGIVIQDIINKAEILLTHPRLGRIVPEVDDECVREISMYSYRIIYELINDQIYMHGVIHKRRHFKPETLKRN
jgi:hypothetical protein